MSFDIPKNLHFAHFFFIDVVGASNPEISTSTQIEKLDVLNRVIRDSKTFNSVGRNYKLLQPTGDGMVIGFLQGAALPLELSIETLQVLSEYNKRKSPLDKIHVRVGCHSGEVFTIDDIYGNTNIWGPGIIIAKRVMDLGDQDHILMSSTMAEILLELSESYKKLIHPINNFELKHNETILLYSIYDDNIGNSARPLKAASTKLNKMDSEIFTKLINCKLLELEISLQDIKSNLLKIKLIYHFNNKSNEPIYKIIFKLFINTEFDFGQLQLKSFDEDQNELKIESIVNGMFEKEFTLKLNNPIFDKKEHFCYYDYKLETFERFFEYLFTLEFKELIVRFDFSNDDEISNPNLYLLRYQGRIKEKIKGISSTLGINTQLSWHINTEIKNRDMLRLEW